MVVKNGDFLNVQIETSRATTKIHLCFDKEIAPGERCFLLILKNKGYGELKKIPMTLPSASYEEEKGRS